MKTDSPLKIQLADYQPFAYDIPTINIAFALDTERTIVTSRLRVFLKEGFEGTSPLVLNGEGLEIIEIKRDGIMLESGDYDYSNDLLTLSGGAEFVLDIKLAINPLANKALSGLYVSSGRFCTQCEAEGFRRITFWPDRPDVMSRFFVRLEANKVDYPTLLANGNCVSFGDFGDGRHFAEWHDPWLKPSYLFAAVAGDFDEVNDSFTTMNGREVALNIYVDKGDASRAIYAMDALKRSMKWDEENYNREYDLDIFNVVAVRDFNAGAMENKGLNIFNSSLLLADFETATDFDFARIESVVAHEYFHNWSGNRVTCRDWFQLSLKEGFTVFRDQEFSADMRSRAVTRIQNIVALRARQFAEDQGPNAHSVRPHEYAAIDNFYTSTIYEKGAEIIRVAKNILGEGAFLAGAINYFEKNDGRAATIEDWLIALRESSSNPLDGIERWYSQAGTPIVELRTEYANEVFAMHLTQHTPDTPNQTNKDWVPIPLDFAFFDQNGGRLEFELEGGDKANLISIVFAQKSLTMKFENMRQKPIVSMLRGFSAPVILKSDHSDAELMILAQFDNDPYVKWESLQTIARKSLMGGAENIVNNHEYLPAVELINAYGEALKNANNDKAFCALLLQLPSTNELIQHMQNAHPEAIFKAREVLAGAIYAAHSQILDNLFAQYNYDCEFVPDANGEGMRALNNQILYYQSFAKNAEEIVANAFKRAKNMTDCMGALNAFARLGGNQWQSALQAFKEKWQHNPLVMDKYYSVQASAPIGDIVENFKSLLQSDGFEITNPNRVRAIAGAFSMNNPVGFHRQDGKGYEAMVDFILEYDKINPSVAARIATAFERVTKIAKERQILAKQQLNRIIVQDVSKQLQEIVSGIFKSL